MGRNFGLNLPPDVPRREPIKVLPPVCWADVGLSFLAGLICALLGFLGACWLFGWRHGRH